MMATKMNLNEIFRRLNLVLILVPALLLIDCGYLNNKTATQNNRKPVTPPLDADECAADPSSSDSSSSDSSSSDSSSSDSSSSDSSSPALSYVDSIRPLMTEHCVSCHSGIAAQGGLDLSAFEANGSSNAERWGKVVERTADGTMPPGEQELDPQSIQLIKNWYEAGMPEKSANLALLKPCSGHSNQQPSPPGSDNQKPSDPGDKPVESPKLSCQLPNNPGWVPLHRLNTTEFNNSVRDLFGLTFNPGDDFSSNFDGLHGSFNNNADSLTFGLSQTEDIIGASDKIIANLNLANICPQATSESDPCIGAYLGDLAERAFRRPTTNDELESLKGLVKLASDNNDSVQVGLELAIKAILISPQFLFHLEIPSSPEGVVSDRLSDYELASRLSFFLWNSVPDDVLIGTAKEGILHQPDVLKSQIERMLKSSKSKQFFRDFTEQWWQLRDLKNIIPNKTIFPEFNDQIRHDFLDESVAFFQNIVDKNLPISALINSDFRVVNKRLADFYQVPGPDSFTRFLSFPIDQGEQRRGVLGLGGVLMTSSHTNRTSLVKRGKWILDNLLCSPPPAPPANVPPFEDNDDGGLSQREKIVQHRSNPACAACHAVMDPLGIGLENFDGIGRWRNEANGEVIDAQSELPNGEQFSSPIGLIELLARQDKVSVCVAEKLANYALSRFLREEDKCLMQSIVLTPENQTEMGFVDVLVKIAQSDLFKMRLNNSGE